jgi:Crinkler effector protein N-terminal domain
MAEHPPADWTLFCIVINGESAFPVDIQSNTTVGALKKAIKKEKEPEFDGFAADRLTLYLVNLLDDDDLAKNVKQPLAIEPLTPLIKVTKQVGDLLPRGPTKETVHILVQTPDPRK